MKKIIFITLSSLLFGLGAHSQNIADHAIGVRFGDVKGFGAEVNYQKGMSETNRIELGLSLHNNNNRNDVAKLVGLYEWVWNIDGGLNWYVGPGLGAGQTIFNSREFEDRNNEFFFLLAGVSGIEYKFDFPLLISFDFRPEVNFGSYRDDIAFDIGIGARYTF